MILKRRTGDAFPHRKDIVPSKRTHSIHISYFYPVISGDQSKIRLPSWNAWLSMPALNISKLPDDTEDVGRPNMSVSCEVNDSSKQYSYNSSIFIKIYHIYLMVAKFILFNDGFDFMNQYTDSHDDMEVPPSLLEATIVPVLQGWGEDHQAVAPVLFFPCFFLVANTTTP